MWKGNYIGKKTDINVNILVKSDENLVRRKVKNFQYIDGKLGRFEQEMKI